MNIANKIVFNHILYCKTRGCTKVKDNNTHGEQQWSVGMGPNKKLPNRVNPARVYVEESGRISHQKNHKV